MVMKKRLYTSLFLVFWALAAMAQIENPVQWKTDFKQVGPDEFDLIFTASMAPGWSIYSQYLESDDGPVRTTFEFDKGDHFQLVGKCEESGNRKEGFDPLFEMNVIKFTNNAKFTQRVKATDLSKAVTGYLTFMTCDDTRCLPPTDVDFSFQLKNTAPDKAPAPTQNAVKEEKEETPQTPVPATPTLTQEGMFDPVKWDFGIQKTAAGAFTLTFTATMDAGWSIYSQFTSDEGPVPTTFYFEEASHYARVGQVEESGKKKEGMDPFFGVQVSKFVEGPVVFTQRITVTDPSLPLKGSLEFMTCNDEHCLPPKEVPFEFSLTGDGAVVAEEGSAIPQTGKYDLSGTPVNYTFDHSEGQSICLDGEDQVKEEKNGLLWILLLGFGGGLLALLTPCVFPMIPLTVSFFTKNSKDKSQGIRNAVIYGLSIVVIYVLLGMVITGVFGADALNLLSTNAWFNIFFALLFIFFGVSFFGYYEITLPSSWSNSSDRMADKGGLIGIFFMAFTLSLVSFSCTGPIIGTLLVETARGGGPTILGRIPVGPLVGMFGFSVALGLPFALFAAFPGWLNSLPKSGGWMNSVKVTLGFVEIALALKFFSVADLTMGWKFMPYELFVGLWVIIAVLLFLYYIGYLRFPHDGPRQKVSLGRSSLALVSVVLAIYISLGFRYSEKSGTFTTPDLLSGLAPPAGHSYIYPKKCPLNLNCYKDFEEGLSYAKQKNMPILLDFTGHGCVNCRKMEDNVWGEPGVFELIRDKYVLISLYVDDREKLEQPYTSAFSGRQMRTVGNKWADFQAIHFNRNSQPYYVLLSPDLKVLNQPVAYTPNKTEYQEFLECGLERFGKMGN